MVLAGVTQMPHMHHWKAPINSSRKLSLTPLTLLGWVLPLCSHRSPGLLYTICPCLLPMADCEVPEGRGQV